MIIGDVRSPQAKNSRNMTTRAWYTVGCPSPEFWKKINQFQFSTQTLLVVQHLLTTIEHVTLDAANERRCRNIRWTSFVTSNASAFALQVYLRIIGIFKCILMGQWSEILNVLYPPVFTDSNNSKNVASSAGTHTQLIENNEIGKELDTIICTMCMHPTCSCSQGSSPTEWFFSST